MRNATRQSGLSLIELMVALALSLVVSGASVAFIAAIIRSNAETIASTRLTQELRSVNEVIAREIRRARYVSDPIGNVGAKDDADDMDLLDTDTPGCIRFGYQIPPGEAGAGNRVFRVIFWDQASGQVLVHGGSLTELTCNEADTPISSPQLEVTSLQFGTAGANRVDILVGGGLREGRYRTERTFRTSVFIRSGRVGS